MKNTILTMNARTAAAVLLTVTMMLATACDKGGDNGDGNDTRTRIPTDPGELAVWNAVYDDEYKYPEGFYTEPQTVGTSINYLGDNGDWNYYKLRHTDSREQAREWWHSMMEGNPDEPRLLGENETDKHFEFVSITQRGHTTRWRLHKSSYFAPTGRIFDTFFYHLYPELYQPYTIGVYGGELSAEAVKELIESLWYFQTYQVGGNKVLSTGFHATSSGFVYTVVSAGVTYGDCGLHDEIRVYESVFELDKGTRELRSTSCTLLHSIQGRYNPGMM
jgi:hypothetical protein